MAPRHLQLHRLGQPEAAARTLTAIYEKAQLLRTQPRIGQRYEPEQSREVPHPAHEHYRIAYLVKLDGNIDILGVFHGALDIDRYFL
jgi:plasmid stabilization system protein ParE